MNQSQSSNIQEENDIQRIATLIIRNYKLFIVSLIIFFGLAFMFNRYAPPLHRISSSILIKQKDSQVGHDAAEFLNSSLLGRNVNFQNELWVLKSAPVIEQTVRNLDLSVTYFTKGRFQFYDAYQNVPFKISYLKNHSQPLNVKFIITFLQQGYFELYAESKNTNFYNFETEELTYVKEKWNFSRTSRIGELVETPDLAFILEYADSTKKDFDIKSYGFEFVNYHTLSRQIKKKLEFSLADREATVIKIDLKSESTKKGMDIVNELMSVYSAQNLERKNHLANITIDYIEKQLNVISDSLSRTEDNLQKFRSSFHLLNITDQATSISKQYMDLQNQHAELVSRKRYFDYVSDLLKNDNFSNVMLPSSIGIADQLLNNLMTELMTAQAQRSNLIENKQERNPLVPKLTIQIENLKGTIIENISVANKTNSIAIDEMENRIRKLQTEISRLPSTQRQLGNIEREYRLNDAIYNYLMEKHAEAKITKASNLPDDIIIEPAMVIGKISPNTRKNYLLAFFLGIAMPFGYLILKMSLNNKIEGQEDIAKLTDSPMLGKIMHNRYKTKNVVFEFPNSDIAESFRSLRTNLGFYVRGGSQKVVLVTSCFENEGKSFVALNLAMSYAHLGRKTILVDFDLRKPTSYFIEKEELQEGLSSYMINKANLHDIIKKSPHEKLDYILSGILPPNPVELIALEKTEELFSELRKDYDIIVLDTTPLAQVTDAYLLFSNAEVKIIISRQNQTLKSVFSIIIKDLHQKNVGNVCIVLNDNRFFRNQYGYGYGYYNKKGFFNRKGKKHKRRLAEYYSPKSVPKTPVSK